MVRVNLARWAFKAFQTRKRRTTRQLQRRDKPAMRLYAEVLEARQLLAAPVANNDSYSVVHDHTLNPTNGVLFNDTAGGSGGSGGGGSLTAVLVGNVSHGSLTLNSNGTFTYNPTANYAGSDSFTYKAFNGTEYSSVATVSLSVTNIAPTASPDSYTIYKDTFNSTTEGVAGVLGNDTDGNTDSLTASLVSGPAHGSLTLNSNGSFSYTPTAGYFGADSFASTPIIGFTSAVSEE